MLIEHKRGAIDTYIVKADCTDDEIKARAGTFLRDVKLVVKKDADVFTDTGKLLLRFRKGVLPADHIDKAYKALIEFAKRSVSSRGIASGSEKNKRLFANNPKVMSNVIGYMGKFTIKEKQMFRELGVKKPPYKIRVSAFTRNYAAKWRQVAPLIRDIDAQYKRLVPDCYRKQRAAALQTAYHFPGTAFTTVTTNVNFQTALHRDKGDYDEGFGNLVVIERGAPYEGGYTCMPQYGVGVDVREGDFLAMDVHQWHSNTPMVPTKEAQEGASTRSPMVPTKEAQEGAGASVRLSLVNYLRQDVWERSKGSTKQEVKDNIEYLNKMYKTYFASQKSASAP